MVEFPSGYRNHYPFLLKPRDQTGGVKFLLIVQERSCVPTPVLLKLTFTPWEWIPLGTAFITWELLCFHTCSTHLPHLQIFLQLAGGKDVDLRTLWCHSINPLL